MMFGYGGMPSFFGSYSPYGGGFGGGYGGYGGMRQMNPYMGGGFGGMRQMNPYMMGGYGGQMQSNPYSRFGGMGHGFGGYSMGGMGGMGGMFGMPRFNPYMMQSFFGSMQRQQPQMTEAGPQQNSTFNKAVQPPQFSVSPQDVIPAGGPNLPMQQNTGTLSGVELARQNDPRLRTSINRRGVN